MKNHSVTVTVDSHSLFDQKCDLLDVIGSLEELGTCPTSLTGILSLLDAISDQIPNYYSDQGERLI